MFIYGAIVSLVCGWLFWSRDRYRNAFYECLDDNQQLTDKCETVTKENLYIKESIVTLYKKPVYALITEEQVSQIGQIVAKHIKEPKWLN